MTTQVIHKRLPILAVEHPLERRLLTFFFGLLIVVFFAYLYFVAASVMNIVARKEADARATNLQGSIGTLEQKYFELSQALTPESASTLGLAPVSQTAYVYRPGNAASAAVLHGNAI